MRELNRQMAALKENNALVEKSRLEISEMRQNLTEIYREPEELIIGGKLAAARELIGRQTKILEMTRIKVYCREPLINAAVSIYARRAEESEIKISIKIDLPEEISTEDSDLAVLLSNLLENAITASKKQKPPLKREISLILRHKGGQNVLEISNRYDYEIKFGESGLPYTTEFGHGLGMSSLEMFIKKYGTYADFSHESGIVCLNLYWKDYL